MRLIHTVLLFTQHSYEKLYVIFYSKKSVNSSSNEQRTFLNTLDIFHFIVKHYTENNKIRRSLG